MYTLADVLRQLQRLGVGPGEIMVPEPIRRSFFRQARELMNEESWEEEDEEDEPY